MQHLKRWTPLAGSIVLVLSVLLRAFGEKGAADAIDVVGNITGVSTATDVSATELTAAAAAFTGIVLKIWSQFASATTPPGDSPGQK